MDITFVIKNVKNKEQAKLLLECFGMPFSRQNEQK
jgi:hypothetical protein